MNKVVLLFLFILMGLITSCSSSKAKKVKEKMSNGSEKYLYIDKNGKFISSYSSGFKDKDYFTKKTLEIPNKDQENILEQSIVFSTLGNVKGKNILRPKISQYTVWFEGKKYFSELKVNPKKKSIDLKMVSPEANWNGTKELRFPSTKSNVCFFSQIVECVKVAGFLDNPKKAKNKMNMYIIWEGYPYLNETYSDFPSELFSKAEVEFDNTTKNNEKKFSVQIAGQSIFYVVDAKNQFKKMFWVSQGITMIEKSEAKKPESSEENESE